MGQEHETLAGGYHVLWAVQWRVAHRCSPSKTACPQAPPTTNPPAPTAARTAPVSLLFLDFPAQ